MATVGALQRTIVTKPMSLDTQQFLHFPLPLQGQHGGIMRAVQEPKAEPKAL